MIPGNNKENESIPIPFRTVKTMMSFIKHYTQITKTYLKEIEALIEKTQSKLKAHMDKTYSNSTKTTSSNLGPNYLSPVLMSQLLTLLKQQTKSIQDIDQFESDIIIFVDQLKETTKKYMEKFIEDKTKLSEKYKAAEKAKQKFFFEANNAEDILIKSKHLYRKYNSNKINLENQKQREMFKYYLNRVLSMNTNHTARNAAEILDNHKDLFLKVKETEQNYYKQIIDYKEEYNDFIKTKSAIESSIIQLNQDCHKNIFLYIQKIINLTKEPQNNISKEIDKFNQKIVEINSLTDIPFNFDALLNNKIQKLKKEQYELKFLDKNTELKNDLCETSKIEIIYFFVRSIEVKLDKNLSTKSDIKYYNFERLIDLLINDKNLCSIFTREDKDLLYFMLSQKKYIYPFIEKIRIITENNSLSMFPEQFKILSNIIGFILINAYNEGEFNLILNILLLSKKYYKPIQNTKNKTYLIDNLCTLPFLYEKEFWCHVFIEALIEEIQNEDEENKIRNMINKVTSLTEVMQSLSLKKDIVLDIFVISFCQFKLDNDVIKVLYNYIQDFYNENEKRKA